MKVLVPLALLALVGCGTVPTTSPTQSPPAPQGSAWPMEGGGPGHAGRGGATVAGPSSEGSVLLVERPGYLPEEYATPIPVGRVAYVGHAGRAFQAVRLDSGEVAWTFPTRGRVFSTAAFSDGRLVFGDDQGQVYAVTSEGKELWRFQAQYPVVASPVAAEGRVFIPCADQNVYCLEGATGRPVWQYGRKLPRKNAIWRSLGLAWGDGRVYAGFSDGTVAALDAGLGKVLWRVELSKEGLFSDVVAGPSFRDGRVYVGSLRGPTVCLDAQSGREIWRQEVELVAGFSVGADLVYAAAPNGKVVALATADGKKAWETSLDGGAAGPPSLAGDVVLAGASEGSLHALDARSGAILRKFGSGSGLRGQPAVYEGGVLFLSNAGGLHWIRSASGASSWGTP